VLVHLRPYLTLSFLAAAIFYYGFQAMTGDRGLLSRPERAETLASETDDLNRLRAERRDLEAHARLLRDGTVSRDLVEERARYLLGFSDPRDYVIRTNP
jgi:cell division protein FtsB